MLYVYLLRRGVDVVTPAGKMLARQLSLQVQPGHSLLVTGPNGSGKTSVFRWVLFGRVGAGDVAAGVAAGQSVAAAMLFAITALWPAATHLNPPHTCHRLLAGLWPLPDGTLHCPGSGAPPVAGERPAVYYVPQRPYTTPGSLRDQVLYPLSMAQVMAPRYAAGGGRDDLDAELAELMKVVRLG